MEMNRSKLTKRLLILFLIYAQWLVNIKMVWFWQPYDIWQTKEDVSGTLEAVQNIQSITQALQKSKENYNAKCVEQERLKKEGATQREIEKVAVTSFFNCAILLSLLLMKEWDHHWAKKQLIAQINIILRGHEILKEQAVDHSSK